MYFQSGDQEALTKLFAGQEDNIEEVRAPFSITHFNVAFYVFQSHISNLKISIFVIAI